MYIYIRFRIKHLVQYAIYIYIYANSCLINFFFSLFLFSLFFSFFNVAMYLCHVVMLSFFFFKEKLRILK